MRRLLVERFRRMPSSARLCARFATALFVLSVSSVALAKNKVVLFPVVPIAGEVDAKVAAEMTEAMLEELKRVDDVDVSLGKEPQSAVTSESGRRPAKSDDTYRAALKDLAEGAKQAQRLRFPQAIKELAKGINGLERNLDMVEDYQKLLDAYVLLAVAHFRRGRESQGMSVLEQVARLAPGLTLDPVQYPPVFLSTFEDAKERALGRPRGAIRVTSAPPGAKVTLNGKELGATPLYIDSVLPGENHVIVKSGDTNWGQAVQVTEANVLEVHANLGAGGPDAPVTLGDAIAANRFDRDVRLAARKLGRDQGGDWVVLGAIGKGKGVLAVGLVMGNARTGKWVTLLPLAPDVDMLSASIEAHNMAKDVRAKLASFAGDLSDDTVPLIAGKAIKSGTRGEGLREQRVSFATSEGYVSSRSSGRAPVAVARREGAPLAVALDGSAAPASEEGSRAPVTRVERTPAIAPPPPIPVEIAAEPNVAPKVIDVEPPSGRLPARRAEAPAAQVPERAQVAKNEGRRGKKGKGSNHEVDELPELVPVRGKAARGGGRRGPVVRGKSDIEEIEAVPQLSSREVAALEIGSPRGGPTGPNAVDLEVEAGESDSVFKKWWFWTAVGAGVAIVGGGSYLLLANREPTTGAMYVVWK